MAQISEERANIISVFEGFREELDKHVDRRERIIKISREITLLSKRIIFALHRLFVDSSGSEAPRLNQADARFAPVRSQFELLSQELEDGALHWRYFKSM